MWILVLRGLKGKARIDSTAGSQKLHSLHVLYNIIKSKLNLSNFPKFKICVC